MSLLNCNAAQEQSVRKPAVANRFYTGNAAQLRNEVEQYIKAAGKPVAEHPQIIISPHAGYIFSGAVAGFGFATIDKSVKKVILIGPSHHKAFTGLSIYDVDAYETPLGKIKQKAQLVEGLQPDVVHADGYWWYPEMPESEPSLFGVWESNINSILPDDPEFCDYTGDSYFRGLLCKIYKA